MSDLKFSRDESGQEVLLKGRHQVMMEWEKPYMHACIDELKPTPNDTVLEVGFGCGYASVHIQKYKPKSHTIIECNPEVILRARNFAKEHPHVTIIEGTWQEALPKLKKFDLVFFDDYPLQSDEEIQSVLKTGEDASMILKAGKKKMEDLQKEIPALTSMVYSNQDLEELFKEAEKEKADGKFLYRFLIDLASRNQITKDQCEHAVDRLLKEKKITPELLKSEEKNKAPSFFNLHVPGDRFFQFLEQCIKNHMHVGARFSCYINSPQSRYEDKIFFDKIISNPYLEFTERLIPVKVPDHCTYYHGDQALVIKITKLGEPNTIPKK